MVYPSETLYNLRTIKLKLIVNGNVLQSSLSIWLLPLFIAIFFLHQSSFFCVGNKRRMFDLVCKSFRYCDIVYKEHVYTITDSRWLETSSDRPIPRNSVLLCGKLSGCSEIKEKFQGNQTWLFYNKVYV